MTADSSKTPAPKAKADDDNDAHPVADQGTTKMSGDKIANAAADTLHGAKAQEEVYPQSDATVLPGGSTLIANEPQPGGPDDK